MSVRQTRWGGWRLTGRLIVAAVVVSAIAAAGLEAISMRREIDRLRQDVANSERQLDTLAGDLDEHSEAIAEVLVPPSSSITQADLDRAVAALRDDMGTDIQAVADAGDDYATISDLAAVSQALTRLRGAVEDLELGVALAPQASAQVQQELVECLAWVYEEVERYRDGQSPGIYFAPRACYSISN
jgi:chromosome segregation ATPase